MKKSLTTYTNTIQIQKNEKLVIDISKCVGNVYDFYGIGLIPIYDMFKVKSLTYNEKKKMADILRGVNK